MFRQKLALTKARRNLEQGADEMMVAWTLTGLMHDVKLDVRNPLIDDAERFRCGIGDVDNPATDIRAAVIDPDGDRLARRDIRDTQPRAERQSAMRSGQFIRIEFFAARRLRALRVEARDAPRRRWRPVCVLVAPKGGMPCRSDTRPGRRSPIVRQRRMTASARRRFEIPGRDRGLGAGREQPRSEHHSR